MLLRRFLAYIIDLFILIQCIGLIGNFMLAMVQDKFLVNYIPLGVIFILVYTYTIYIYILKRTIGQRVCGIEYYIKDGDILTFKKILKRCLFMTILMAITFWYGIFKKNIFIIDNISGFYVRKYEKPKP